MHNQDILLSDGSIQFALFIKSKSPRTWHNFFDSVTAFLGKGQHIFPTQHTLDMKKYYAGPIHYCLSIMKRL